MSCIFVYFIFNILLTSNKLSCSSCQIQNIFGIVLHANHAIFKEVALENKNGQPIGFTKHCDTWCGSHLYATLRLLRLKPIFQACCKTSAFLKLKRHRNIAIVLSKERVFDFIFAICLAFYAVFYLILLADSKQPCMHLLKSYVLQFDRTLDKYFPKIELKYATIPQNIQYPTDNG